MLVGLVFACADDGPSFVAWPEELEGLNFVLHHRGNALVQVFGPFEPGPDGKVASPLQVTLEEDDGLVLLGLSAESLAAHSPRLRLEDRSAIELVASPDSCERTVIENEEYLRLRMLEPKVRLLRGPSLSEDLTTTILDTLSLRAPHDATASCRLGETNRLVPFLSELVVPPESSMIEGAVRQRTEPGDAWSYYSPRDLAWLDEDRLVIGTGVYLYRVERDQPFDSGPTRAHLVRPPSPPVPDLQGWYITGVDVDPRSIGTGIDRVLVSYAFDPTQSAASGPGALWLYTFDDDGLIDARALVESPVGITSVAVDARGSFLAGAEGGRAFFGTVDQGALESLSTGVGSVQAGTEVRDNRTLFGPSFYLLTNPIGVFSLKLDGEAVVAFEPLSTPANLTTPRGFALRTMGDVSPEIWVGTYSTGLWRRPVSGAWDRVRLEAGVQLTACASQTVCGRASIDAFIRTVAVRPDGRLLLGASGCSAAMLLDVDTGCIDAVPLEGEAVQRLGNSDRVNHVAVSRDGQTAFIGDDGVLSVFSD